MRILLLALGLALLAPGTPAARTLVHAGALIDGVSDETREDVTVIIEDGRFLEVRAGRVEPGPDDDVLDLSGYTVLPGLMDMHVHLAGELSKDSYVERYRLNPTDYALRGSVFARRTLEAGFTTVRDLGDDGMVVVSLRNAIRGGWIPGPRIFTAGKSLATTGGHADPTNGRNRELTPDPGPKEGVVNGPDDVYAAVRWRYKQGADLIKLTATGGVLSLAASGQNPQFTDEELDAVVAAARDYGFPVAVHAHGAEGMERAVRAGVDSIEHGTYMTPEIMELMRDRGTFYVPTILAGVEVGERSKEDDFFPAVVRPKAAAIGPLIHDTFRRAYAAGVRIAFGTDSGVSRHGDNAIEFALMVEGGMPPMEAIQSATIEAARLLRREEQLGSIEPGKLADLIAVQGDPLEDITVLQSVSVVIKDGVVEKDNR